MKTGSIGRRLALLITGIVFSGMAHAIPIDLGAFHNSSPANVHVTADGVTAFFNEDPVFSPVFLSHTLLLPTDASTIKFEYALAVRDGNEDYFDFYIDDLAMPEFSVGGVGWMGASGAHSVDVRSLAGTSVDVVFSFLAGWSDGGLNSLLTIRNVEISHVMMPAPASLFLVVGGLIGLFGARRKIRSDTAM